MTQEHPFAQYVRILGRGKTNSRSLKPDEAEQAMGMIVRDEVLPAQLGAFLMLLRLKEETAEEIAGFVRAVRASFPVPDAATVDLDWSSYAGKRRQLPWFLLAAIVLARHGVRVFMHGAEGHTPGRLYTRAVLEALDLPVARSLEEAADHVGRGNFVYLPLTALSPRLDEIIDMRPIFGLRSPVHTIARMLNPFAAPCMMQGIFHTGYMNIHQEAARLLGQPHMAVFRGEGGEIERRPNKPCEVYTVHDGVAGTENWPKLLPDPRQQTDTAMEAGRLLSVWRGETEDAYADTAVIGTLAIALKLLGRAATMDEAQKTAETLWRERDRGRFLEVA